MNVVNTEIRVKGKAIQVPSVRIDGRTVIATGKRLTIAALRDEELQEGGVIAGPDRFVSQLKKSNLKADIFTFVQRVPDVIPKYPYHLEWDNAAVVPITTFSEWWEKRAQYDVRKAVKRAQRLGVIVRESQFDDAFVQGICGIYNDSPVRQGTAFWHYQKDFAIVKQENATYLEKSVFIGAYYQDALIGFIKMVYVDTIATTLQVISQKMHYDKKPMNALIAKAVEICEKKGVSHLVYGNFTYDGHHSSLTEFKRRNGFAPMLVPRYYIPLSITGAVALKLNLHHSWAQHIPDPLMAKLRTLRSRWYHRKLQVLSETR